MVSQMPYADKARVFAASSVEDETQARQELENWARGHGYQLARAAGTFTIFGRDAQAREWVLLERPTNRN